MDVEQLGAPEGPRSDPERHEGPRTALVLVAAGVLGLLAVGGVFWLVTAGLGPSGGGSSSSDQVAGPAAVSTGDATTADDGPTTITSTRTSTTTTSTTPRPSLDLPPPEQPTYTLAPTAVPTTTAGGGPVTTAPGPPAPTTAGARVTNAQLTCTGNRKSVKATLTFTTTAPVQAYVVGGGKVTSGVRGPGDVSMTASGNGTGYCLATVGGQTLGPVPAR